MPLLIANETKNELQINQQPFFHLVFLELCSTWQCSVMSRNVDKHRINTRTVGKNLSSEFDSLGIKTSANHPNAALKCAFRNGNKKNKQMAATITHACLVTQQTNANWNDGEKKLSLFEVMDFIHHHLASAYVHCDLNWTKMKAKKNRSIDK